MRIRKEIPIEADSGWRGHTNNAVTHSEPLGSFQLDVLSYLTQPPPIMAFGHAGTVVHPGLMLARHSSQLTAGGPG